MIFCAETEYPDLLASLQDGCRMDLAAGAAEVFEDFKAHYAINQARPSWGANQPPTEDGVEGAWRTVSFHADFTLWFNDHTCDFYWQSALGKMKPVTRAHITGFTPGGVAYLLDLPAGLEVVKLRGGQGAHFFALNEFPADLFPLGSILRHDITHRYLVIKPENIGGMPA